MKIIYEHQKCIGCGSCAALCPKYFELDQDNKSHLIGSKKDSNTENQELEVEKVDCIQEAAEACPVQIIHLIKE